MNSIATAKFSCLVPSHDGKRGLLRAAVLQRQTCLHDPIHGELDGCCLRLTKVPRKHSPFPQQLIRLNGLAAGALRQKRATASFFPARVLTIFVFLRLADIPNSPIFDQIRLRARAGSTLEFATLLTPLPFSIDPVWLSRTGFSWGDQHLHSHRQCSGLRSASYAPPPAARPIVFRTKKISSAARASRSALSDV